MRSLGCSLIAFQPASRRHLCPSRPMSKSITDQDRTKRRRRAFCPTGSPVVNSRQSSRLDGTALRIREPLPAFGIRRCISDSLIKDFLRGIDKIPPARLAQLRQVREALSTTALAIFGPSWLECGSSTFMNCTAVSFQSALATLLQCWLPRRGMLSTSPPRAEVGREELRTSLPVVELLGVYNEKVEAPPRTQTS